MFDNITTKQRFQCSEIQNILFETPFVGVISTNTLTVQDRIELKQYLSTFNIRPRIIKNSLLIKLLITDTKLTKLRNLKLLPQGSIILLLPIDSIKVEITSLKDLLIYFKRKKIIFLGGYIQDTFFNQSFIKQLPKNKETIFSELLGTLQMTSMRLLNSNEKISRDFSFLLGQKVVS